jgi:hypothetical protein
MVMKRPTEEIEKLRAVAGSGKIDPTRKYRIDIGNGQIMECTGAELIETAEATVAFADAEKRGDKAAMLAAMKRLGLP